MPDMAYFNCMPIVRLFILARTILFKMLMIMWNLECLCTQIKQWFNVWPSLTSNFIFIKKKVLFLIGEIILLEDNKLIAWVVWLVNKLFLLLCIDFLFWSKKCTGAVNCRGFFYYGGHCGSQIVHPNFFRPGACSWTL